MMTFEELETAFISLSSVVNDVVSDVAAHKTALTTIQDFVQNDLGKTIEIVSSAVSPGATPPAK